ncbi:uncharacterized protein LOC110924477 [Helianthus annuus]|uniref:uncharacterized protein LOC110924477 n=1 Tax=Helianthus annuus TaxID=4232 RepID=UPI000B8FE665|nr:uncharacterized protein LOC110924477 [Helianthus annuus]
MGDGQSAFLWFDKWSIECPLANMVTPRQMARFGFSVKSKVAEAIQNGVWVWPDEWRTRYPVLFQLLPLTLSNEQDRVTWRNSEGKLVPFASKEVWESIRIRKDPVAWSRIVWSSFNIPKHVFMCWLIFKRKLWTQDRILKWNHMVTSSMNQMCCLLCYVGLETHDHLFFQCSYSRSVWWNVRLKVGMDSVQETWEDISSWLVPRAKSRDIYSVAGKLVVAAASYAIWCERNTRFFSNCKTREDLSMISILTCESAEIKHKLIQE